MKLILALLLFAAPAQASLIFDGTDDDASCGTAAAIDDPFSGGGTVCLRFRRDVTNAFDILASKINGGTFQGWSLALGDNGSPSGTFDDVYFYQSADAGANGYEGFGTAVAMTSTTAEYFICLQYNASNYTTAPTASVNGTSMTLSWSGSGTVADSDAAESFRFASQGGSYFDGSIREGYLWTSSLSTAQMNQITANVVRGSARAIDTANLIDYWPMDDQESGSAADGDTVNAIIGGNDCTASDGANNTGMTWASEYVRSYP